MKLYGDFEKEDWLNALNVKEDMIPRSLIVHGKWEHKANIQLWKKILKLEQWIPGWNMVVGTYEREKVGFANVFGGPMVASIAHRFAILGTENFIQTGYFGGLSSDVQYGDIFIVTKAVMEDGVSHWYQPNQRVVTADPQLIEAAIQYCEQHNYRYQLGTVFTTGAIMMETRALVEEWSDLGYIGVDMETATTLAVAKYFGKRAIGLLNLSDHLVKGDTLYDSDEKRAQLEEETDRKIRELALYLATAVQ